MILYKVLFSEQFNDYAYQILTQAKKFVESVPQTVRADLPKEEAEKLKASLEAVGATVVLE